MFIDIYIMIHGFRIDYWGFRKRAINYSLMTRKWILSTRESQKIHNTIRTPPCTCRQRNRETWILYRRCTTICFYCIQGRKLYHSISSLVMIQLYWETSDSNTASHQRLTREYILTPQDLMHYFFSVGFSVEILWRHIIIFVITFWLALATGPK